MRSFALALLLSALVVAALPQAGRAERVFLAPADAPPPPRDTALVVDLPGARLLVAPDGEGTVPGREFAAPEGADFFLLEPHGPGGVFGALPSGIEVLARFDRWLLVTVDQEDLRPLDALPGCKQRLAWLPPAPERAPSSAAKTTTAVDPALKAQLVERCGLDAYTDYLRELSGDKSYWINSQWMTNGDRYTFSYTIARVEAYLRTRLEAMGYRVEMQAFPVGGQLARNVVAIKEGSVHPDSVVVVGAHYDAIASNLLPKHPAPGAEDNASGSAAVLTMAEVFSHYETEKTVHFVLFGAEEQGLYGSQHYVDRAVATGQRTVGALTMDMIAAWEDEFAVIIEGDHPWEWLMSLYESNLADASALPSTKTYFSYGSDHVPFQQAGIAAFLAIDKDWAQYDHYHRSTDTFDKTDPTLGLAIFRGIAAAVADLAVLRSPTPAAAAVPGLVLGQNHPNPCNPRTTISWRQSSEGEARLEIFDAAGRRIRDLRRGWFSPGEHRAVWDGRDDAGRPVASGVYRYRLRRGAETLSRPLVLVR